jgi:putative methyltransferase (TIGR04325 family)
MRLFKIHLAGVSVDVQVSRESSSVGAQRQYTSTHNTYHGDFTSWQDAIKHAKGYDSPLILKRAVEATRAVVSGDAACERDTVLFDRPQIAHPLLAWLLYAASVNQGYLSVMDVGGALGSSYRQNRPFLSHLQKLRWGVVEQENFVKVGQAEFQTDELQFFPETKDCFQVMEPNFLLLSSVLQYLEHPYQLLAALLQSDIPFVLIDRTMAHRFGRDRLAVQKVPPTIYDASYPVWLLNSDRLEEVFKEAGYETVDHFDPHPGSTFGPPDFSSPYAGWFLRKG